MDSKRRSVRRSRAIRFGHFVVTILCAPGVAGGQICPDVHPPAARSADRASAAGSDVIRIVAVGDIMLGTDFPDSTYLDSRIAPDVAVEDLIGAALTAVLRSGDVVFGNLEGALFDGGGESKRCRNMDACYVFRSPEWYAGLLADMGFNVMSLANNHAGDFLEPGREATIAALERRRIAYAGLDRPGARAGTVELADGTRVGLLAFSPNKGTLSIHDPERAARLIRELKRTHDLVIVSFHGGAEGADRTHVTRGPEEFYGERRGDVYEFAHGAVDAGADVVIGHGPHVPRAVEIYRGRFIAYSLGNFWTWARFNLRGPSGLAPVLDLEVERDGRALAARIVSARQVGLGSPRLDPGGRAARLIADLTAEDFPGAELSFADDGRISWTTDAGAGVEGDEQ